MCGAYFDHLLCLPPIIIDHLINELFLFYYFPSNNRRRSLLLLYFFFCLPVQSVLAGEIGTNILNYVSYQPCFALLRHVSLITHST